MPRIYDPEQIQKIADAFQSRANSFTRGYCKPWKANGIVFQMADLIDVGAKVELFRIQEHMTSCLRMEGFTIYHCELIGVWLFIELQAYFDSENHKEREARRIKADNPRETA